MAIKGSANKKLLVALFTTILFFGLTSPVARALESKVPQGKAEAKIAAGKSTALTQSYLWYDGTRERKVWLNPHVLAEFNPGSQSASVMKSANATARIVEAKNMRSAIRLWQIDNPAEQALSNLRVSHPKGKYSVVLHDTPSGSSRMRSLPGNVIVYLNPQWNVEEVNNWLATRKLDMVKKLEIGPNIYVIKSGPGIEALSVANEIYQSGEVIAAFPDWWEEVATR